MTKLINNLKGFLLIGLLVFSASCEREIDELELATFPSDADVFIDGFPGGLVYSAFGGSDVTAFDTDTEIKYAGTTSMRFSVPDLNNPTGGYAGGAFFLESGRDLSGYNVLSFWARASQAANIDNVGIGNYLGGNEYVSVVSGLAVTTNWKKYYIPIPNASKLTQERGLLYYSEAPEDGRGYTFWLDEVQFENLGTVIPVSSSIFNGEDRASTLETGAVVNPEGSATFNLPTGIDQESVVASAYFDFTSSDPSVAIVDSIGQVVVVGPGETVITASLNSVESAGSLTITAIGAALLPATPAPVPTVVEADVISIYSDAYTNVPVDFYNGFWMGSTTQSTTVSLAADDEIIRYSQLNFVGIQFTSPLIDASTTNRMHLDVWTPDAVEPPTVLKIEVVDFGPNGSFDGGGDDATGVVNIASPALVSGSWVSIDIPFSDLSGLSSRSNLAQVVLSGGLENLIIDNLYFYDDGNGGGGGGNEGDPPTAAPTPTRDATNVISLFSDAYNDVPVDTWRADFSNADFQDVNVAGNATKKYSNLAFAGIEMISSQIDVTGMTNLHMDVWSEDFTFFAVKLVDFGPDGAFEGGDDTEFQINIPMPAQEEWLGYNFALSDFTDLTGRENIAQIIIVAEPSAANTVFIDNVYFYNDDGGSNPTAPTSAAPTPTFAAANVISLFSDAYTDVSIDTWRTDWSMGNLTDLDVAGNATKRYTELDFVGIETTSNQIDATGMTHFHINVWTADATSFSIKLVDFGADGAFEGGDDVEHQIDFPMPAQGQWITYDIELSDFTGLTTRANLAQYILVGQPSGASTIFVDNVLFHN